MTSRIAVVPGSFDPPTLGHLDVIARAAALFDRLDVVVVHNPHKTPLLSLDERAALLRAVIDDAGIGGDVRVDVWASGLLVDYVRRVGAHALVKGIRSPGDVTYEAPMALVNRDLAGVETVFLLSDPAHALVSSSLVRQVSSLGGDVSPYVPAVVARRLTAGA